MSKPSMNRLRSVAAAGLGILAMASLPALSRAQSAAGTLTMTIPKGAPVLSGPLVALTRKALPQLVVTLPKDGGVSDATIAANMKGWTALTSTASLGGASLVVFKGQTAIVTTGSDGSLYIAPFDPNAPALISDWQFQPGGLVTEPHCRPYQATQDLNPGTTFRITCLGLTKAGEAKMVQLRSVPGAFGHDYDYNLGGISGPGAPVFLSSPYVSADYAGFGATSYLHYDVGVLASNQLWAENVIENNQVSGFAATKLYMNAGPACLSACFVTNSDGKTVRAMAFKAATGAVGTFTAGVQSPIAPVALTGESTAISTASGQLGIVIVRGSDGQLYQISYDTTNKAFVGGWKAGGGYVRAGSYPSCVDLKGKPLCVIQGADGKLYAKTLNAAGAL